MRKHDLIIGISALLGVMIFFYLEKNGVSRNCLYGLDDLKCNSVLYLLESMLFISFPALTLSFLTIFLKKPIRFFWQKFTYWYVAIFALIVLIFPESNGGGGWISGGGPTKATYGLLLSVLYFLLSVILIIRKSWQLRGK